MTNLCSKLTLAALLLSPPMSEVSGQDTSRTARLDSLARQIANAEARIGILEQQLASKAASAVETRSGARLQLSGRLLVNAFTDSRRVNNVDNPQFTRPDSDMAIPASGFGMSPRQSTMRIAAIVPGVARGTFVGDLDVDFGGGQQSSSGGRTFPLIRMRTLRATLRWEQAELMIGQDVPLIAPHNPVSVASIGTPGFATAGNLWLWLPQVRATIETSTRLHLGVQGAVLAPSSGDAAAAFDTDFDVAERSSRPTLQARARARWGDRDIGGEIGCGAHLGWMAVDRGTAPDGGSMIESNAVACDARIPFLRRLELRAEAYRGQALRGLGGGGIGQGIGPGSRPVHDEGGWAQLLVTPVFSTTFAMGCGVDDPDDADLPTTGRLRNAACSVSAQLRPVDPMFIGIEFRRITTTYASGRYANDHFNLGIGFVY